MKKEINCLVKLEIKGGEASPGLKQIGQALGGKIGNIMDFCKQFNSQTQENKGVVFRVVVTAYKDKSFEFILKGTPTSILLKNKLSISKGSSEPNRKKIGFITLSDVRLIAQQQLPYLNAFDIDGATKIIIGSAKRMGLEIK